MCLGIPGKIIDITSHSLGEAQAELRTMRASDAAVAS